MGRVPAKIAALCAVWSAGLAACGQQPANVVQAGDGYANASIRVGAENFPEVLDLLKERTVAVVCNHTALVHGVHLVDTLRAAGVNVVKVFAPEHGFRGEADAGEHVLDGRDQRSGLPLISLYGSNKKPTKEQLLNVDVLVFDIQDVGVRFYTYISTLHYVMEAAAEQGKKVVVLDRPNPNGFYIDGPVLASRSASFVGLHPVPLVHGMTVGEFARMINGEKWLKGGVACDLTVVPCQGYEHRLFYELPVRPSPNLPNMSAVYLYPSLGLFEGTIVSVGRGTDHPFQMIGFPGNTIGRAVFTPHSVPGAKDPPYKGLECRGLDLREYGSFQSRLNRSLNLQWLLGLYEAAPDKKAFFTSFFDKLAGGSSLREQVEAGWDEDRIRASWQPALSAFRQLREQYLLYP